MELLINQSNVTNENNLFVVQYMLQLILATEYCIYMHATVPRRHARLEMVTIEASNVAGVLLYQVTVSIRCIFFLPLGSFSVWLSLGKLLNRRPHVLPEHTNNVPVHTNSVVRN